MEKRVSIQLVGKPHMAVASQNSLTKLLLLYTANDISVNLTMENQFASGMEDEMEMVQVSGRAYGVDGWHWR